MNTVDLKTELQQLIEREKDLQVLEAIKTLLQKTSLDPVLKDKLTSRAKKSESDIAENKLFTYQEALNRTGKK